jgi:hypothetical protein
MLRNTPVEGAPAGAPAPAAPVPIVTPPPVPGTEEGRPSVILEDGALEAKVDEKPVVKVDEPDVPSPRQRRRVAIVEAIDKVTADRMRFEVEVGGRPVRFNGALIFTARACEVTAPSEAVNDAIAYLDITLEPKGTAVPTAARQIFRGWMFASTPALSGLQHPVYDAWVVGCRA